MTTIINTDIYVNDGLAATAAKRHAERAAALVGGLVAGTVFEARADLVTWNATNDVPPGAVVYASGFGYLGQTGATSIPDMPGLVPAGLATPYHYGAVEGTDTANAAANATAVQAMMDAERVLYFPRGDWVLNDRLVSISPKNIVGEGMMVSRLRWTDDATSEGIKIVSGDDWGTSTVRDVSLLTAKEGVGTALEIDYSGNIDGGIISPRASSHARIRDVRIAGATGYTVDGWLKGVDAISLLGLDIAGCRINGVFTGDGSEPESDTGVSFGGSGSPVQLKIDRTEVSLCKDAVSTEDAEGIYITSCEFVSVERGLKTRNAVGESGLVFTGNHVAAFDACIDLEDMADGTIADNIFYNAGSGESSWPATLDGVRLGDGANKIRVTGNQFIRVGTTTAYTSIRMDDCEWNDIGPNTHGIGAGDKAVIIGSGASNCHVAAQNTRTSSATPYVDGGTGNAFDQFRNFAGSVNAIALRKEYPLQVHSLAAGVTDGPSDLGATGGAMLLTYTFDANAATQHLFPAGTGTSYTRRRTSGTWGAWERTTSVYGSSASGHYEISPTGVLQCWHSVAITSVIDTVVSMDWTFPFAAVDSNSRVFTNVPSAQLPNITHSASAITTTKAQINLRRSDSAVATAVHVHMIGRAW